MVTNVTNFSRSGLYDWMAQRVSAVVLAAYFLFLIGFLVMNPGLGYAEWHGLFAHTAMRIFSLLALVAGFLAPVFQSSGSVLLDGRDVLALPAEQRRIGLLFQDPLLFPHLSVGGNLRFALPAGTPDKDARVHAALAAVGLEGYADRDPDTLSGGQKSRVALQRLLLSEPHAVLLDEPFSRLDAGLRRDVRALVFSTLKRAGLPTLMVTHDPEDAEAAGGRIVNL